MHIFIYEYMYVYKYIYIHIYIYIYIYIRVQGLSTALRNPREGEKIVSMNGSPLGDFRTVVKSKNIGNSNIMPPPTPGFVTLGKAYL
jgi:hypothetical protein